MSTRKSKRSRGDRPPLPPLSTNIVSPSGPPLSASVSASLSTSASSVSNLGNSTISVRIKPRSWNAKIWKHYNTHDGSEYDDLVPRAFCKYCDGGPILALSGKGRLYPTSNLYFKCVWKVELLLLKYGSSEDKVLKDMANMMKKKFDKYWSSFSMILSFAIMLDPRYKFEIIRHCFEKLDVESATTKSLHVKEEFQKLFQEYNTERSETSRNQDMENEDFEGFATSLYDHSRKKSEFDVYFNEPLECHSNSDVLDWWKKNECKFPSLAKMAKDVLAIPITTVASESAFSMGSRVITKWRSSLHKETAEALLITRSWLYGLDIEEGSMDNLEDGLEIHLSRLQDDNDNEDEDSDMED